ncbi:MAG TPA: BON domain-containing protein, partial [Chloroflexia bacterium]|nr:BON domain-containing protein [Chloroflexia bacterium]
MDSETDTVRDSYTGEPTERGGDVLDLSSDLLVESEEPDFSGDPGTTDVMEAVENGEVYFPPTDPVVRISDDRLDGLEVQGGFAETALDEPLEGSRQPERMKFNDEEIAENVINALRNDAYTTDLDIDVEVVDGIVYLRGRVNSLEDVEQAEEVAGRVEGIVDVEEELDIV